MIIACPKCTGPYQLADDQVAPLVQVQCPHCEYRVILDFAAANDPSLREPEMLLADGFRSADDYQQALADGHQVASYDLPAPPPTPVVTRPTAPTTPPVAAQSTSTPASRPQPTPVLETPSPSSLLSGSALSDKPGSLGAAVQDFTRPEPESVAEIKPAEPVAEVKPEKPAEPVAEVKPEKPAEPIAEVRPEKPAEPATQPEARTPPHTPPVTPTAKEPPTPELRPGKPIEPAAESGKRPIEKAPEKPAERPVEKAPEKQAEAEGGRGPGLILLIFLIIIAAVFAVTYLKTGSFDPRLLLSPPAPPPT